MNSNIIQIFIVDLHGRNESLIVNVNSFKILKVKQLLVGIFNVAVENQRLIHCGRELKNEELIKDLNIQDSTALHFVDMSNNDQNTNNNPKIKRMLDIINKLEEDYKDLEEKHNFLLEL
jgi:hypothetical protein